MLGFAVQRRPEPHIPGDVRNGHDQPVSRPVGLGEDRVVEIACIVPVDGQELQGVQIGATAQPWRPCLLGFVQNIGRERMRDIIRYQRNQADRASVVRVAQPLQHACRTRSIRTAGQGLRPNDLTVFGAIGVTGRHRPHRLGSPARRLDTTAAWLRAKNSQHPGRGVIEKPYGASFVATRSRWPEPCQHALSRCQSRGTACLGLHQDQRGRPGLVPFQRASQRIPVFIGAGNQDRQHRGQMASRRRARSCPCPKWHRPRCGDARPNAYPRLID